jgi:hypothetical protein
MYIIQNVHYRMSHMVRVNKCFLSIRKHLTYIAQVEGPGVDQVKLPGFTKTSEPQTPPIATNRNHTSPLIILINKAF